MVENILMWKDPNKITDYISTEEYAQHNPGIKDGRKIGINVKVAWLIGSELEY